MTTHALHWGDGLFLRPHLFQAMERRVQDLIHLTENWSNGYAYGLHRIEIDKQALENWRVSLSACHIRLQDGTHIRFPEDATLAPLEVPREAFMNAEQRVAVRLAIPHLKPGRKNVDVEGTDRECRYSLETIDVEDDNQPGNAQPIDFRWPNVRLMLGDEDLSGYETLPVMRLRLGTTAEAPPEIDADFIPPLLVCEAWQPLRNLLTSIYDRLGGIAERLAQQMNDRGVAFASGHREDFERILKLQSVNTALGYVTHLPFVRGLHPVTAYSELCRVVGLLAIFRPQRHMPAVPPYDHDNLATCFHAIRQLLDVGEQQQRAYIKRDFKGAGLQMQARLEREWLKPSWQFFIGVHSRLTFSQVDRLLMQRLDMKVGNSDDVDTIYKFARAGARLVAVPDPPRDFPQNGWTYWRVDRRSDQWQAVEETLNLGIRFNERQVEGRIDGEQQVQVSHGESGELTGLSFALYAMPSRSG